MKQEELRELKARTQRLELLVTEFSKDVETLHSNGVDVTTSTDISKRQREVQDEIEQVISDLLAVLDQSSSLQANGAEIQLPNTGRRPVSDASLPQPRFERSGDLGKPNWVKGHKKDNMSDTERSNER